MALIDDKSVLTAMYRRWAYMVVAIVSAAVMFTKPVLNFNEDKGIIYVRSFTMDQTKFYVTQTKLDGSLSEITAMMSVKGLYWCNKLMLWGTILCFLCFFSNPLRITIAAVTAFIAGAYYVILMYYAMKISENHYATLYPNFMVIWPAVVCQMMILTRHNVIRTGIDNEDKVLDADPILD